MTVQYDQFGNVIGDFPAEPPVVTPTTKTKQKKVYETKPPKALNVGDTSPVGSPTISNLGRGVSANTGIAVANSNREHACDVAVYIKTSMAKAKVLAGDLVKAIRKAIRAVMDALGISPSSSGMTEFLKDLARRIKEITRWIQDKIVETAKYIQGLKEIRAIIEYILSLPAELLGMFQKCLSQAYGELSKGLFAVAGEFTSDPGVTELTDSAKDVLNETQALLQTTQAAMSIPAAAADALLSPSGMSAAEKEKLVLSLYPDSKGTKYDKTTYEATI
jgi:hypothetical protein